MKKNLSLFAAVVLLLSACTKDEVTAPTVTTVTKADLLINNNVGAPTYNYYDANVTTSTVAVPARGQNQTWDFSALNESASGTSATAISVSNSSFPTVTYGRNSTVVYQAGGASVSTPSVYYREVADSGIFDLGFSIAAATLSVPSIGGTLTYPAQAIPYTGTTKMPILKTPAKYGDSTATTNLSQTINFTANAPALGVNNVPAQRKDKMTITQAIIGSGTIKLKGLGTVPVLVQKGVLSITQNYFLGGAPAPAALLGVLGLTDGATVVYTSYDFFAPGLGYCGTIYLDATGKVSGATFRKS